MDRKNSIDAGFNNISFYEEMFWQYQKDPKSVDRSWKELFSHLDGHKIDLQLIEPQSHKFPIIAQDTPGDIRIYHLIEAYRKYGHLMANINPIATWQIEQPKQLELQALGFQEEELNHFFPTCGLMDQPTAPLSEIIQTLQTIYCGSIGIEYVGSNGGEMELWLQSKIEPNHFQANLSIEQKQLILHYLNKSEIFEVFLHTKYVGQKRFSLEGEETLIPILAFIINQGSDLGVNDFVIGMAHRGRLNVLCNILDKSYVDVFSEFEESYIPDSIEGSGDVKYHKGFYSQIRTDTGHDVRIYLTPNPSHLESVDPVVEGQTKAKQVEIGEGGEAKVMPILIHGDAAISGQGVVYETMQFGNLAGFQTGGTVHIVINNQIGFTTLPSEGRSTRYCTDIAKAFGAPVFHVNAEDPEACVSVTLLALELRQKFHRDVFIDIVGYRKYGHNESDEPAFTQPLEYQLIRKKQPIRDLYRDQLIQQGVVEKHVAETLETEFKEALNEALKGSKLKLESSAKKTVEEKKPMQGNLFQPVNTGVPVSELQKIGERCCSVPEKLVVHKKLQGLLEERLQMARGEKPIDWGMGEILAYASLLWEGRSVRLSGQDCGRGTFSHRHALWMAQNTEQKYFPLSHLKQGQGRCDVLNSPLSEYAALGFEFGYSMANPEVLVLWEAQFGDFCNGAQIIIDQYLSTSEQKWGVKSSLVLLLPHGYEGQGPEHSSARIERFLALAGQENMYICNATTPAQFFHLLRRQLLGKVYKPLILFTPKGLLRHSLCVSSLEELEKDTFEEVIDDPISPKQPARLVFCSGRIFYDLMIEREKMENKHIAIIRIEQLYPLHLERIQQLLAKYETVEEYLWVQEEPRNMGAWDFIHHHVEHLLPKGKRIRYVGRERSASPAGGSLALHRKQHAAMMKEIFPIEEQPDTNLLYRV